MVRYDLSNLSVLVAEDNPPMLRMIREILLSFGVGMVHEATDGEQAIERLAVSWVDLMIVDWTMEPMDGLTFVRHVRSLNRHPAQTVPVIMLTGHTSQQHVEEARDAGVNEYLAKPISTARLMGRLIEIIERPRPFIRSPGYNGPDRRRKEDVDYNGPRRRTVDRMIADPALNEESGPSSGGA